MAGGRGEVGYSRSTLLMAGLSITGAATALVLLLSPPSLLSSIALVVGSSATPHPTPYTFPPIIGHSYFEDGLDTTAGSFWSLSFPWGENSRKGSNSILDYQYYSVLLILQYF